MKDLKSILRIALGLLALLFAVTLTSAEEAPKERKPSKETLEKYDANKDGKLDEAEKAAMKADEDAAKAAKKAEKEAAREAKKAGKDAKVVK